MQREHIETVVIGAGQAGLSVGYHLKRLGLPFVILEGSARVGDQWRRRWDSLRLFTPARFDGLDGMPMPRPGDDFITKDQMADYLEAYAVRFELPVRTGVRVEHLTREGERFVLTAGGRRIEADQVVVAMANYQQPKLPAFAGKLEPAIVQLHSREYKNPSQLRPGRVLIVGAGNSGAEIAMDVAATHETWVAGRDTGHLPFRVGSTLGQRVLAPLVLRVLFHRVFSVSTPIGRRMRPKMMHGAGPLIRQRPKDLLAAGIQRVPRMAGVQDGRPLLEDGRVLDVENVIWCTGFHPGFGWIDLPVFDEQGEPKHERGIVGEEPGLYFVGLNFLYAYSSTMVHGVGRDAKRIAEALAKRVASEEKAGARTLVGDAAGG
jgi:putative flavoprotein involved in K+ transport